MEVYLSVFILFFLLSPELKEIIMIKINNNNDMVFLCGILSGTNLLKWKVGFLGALKAYLAICV